MHCKVFFFRLHLYLFYILTILFLLSCGIRQDKSPLTNLLDGNWKLNKFECYLNNELQESFSIESSEVVELSFKERDIFYEISGTCNEISNAKYSYAFSTIKTGLLTFYELNLGNSCSLLLDEDTVNESVTVQMQLSTTQTTNLIWDRNDENFLSLTHFNQFSGSSLVEGCNSSCNCFSIWQKN